MLGIWTQIHSTKPVPWNGKFFTVFDEYPLRPSPSPSQMMVLWVQNCDANTNYSDPWFCTSTISLNSTKTFKLGRITVLRVGPTCLVYFTLSSAAPFTVAISQLCCRNIFIAYINSVTIVHLRDYTFRRFNLFSIGMLMPAYANYKIKRSCSYP